MYGQAHAGLGWLIGVFSPGSDRRLRVWCAGAALLPDVDCVAYAWGVDAYRKVHHTFGHNIFLGLLCVAAAAWHYRDRRVRERVVATLLVALCFASHLLTDMKFSGWTVALFWPVSLERYEFHPNYELGAPVNMALVYSLMAFPFLVPVFGCVTPLDFFSPRLDRLVRNIFTSKPLTCGACGKSCNNRCDACGGPTCMKHARIGWRLRIACPSCVKNT